MNIIDSIVNHFNNKNGKKVFVKSFDKITLEWLDNHVIYYDDDVVHEVYSISQEEFPNPRDVLCLVVDEQDKMIHPNVVQHESLFKFWVDNIKLSSN